MVWLLAGVDLAELGRQLATTHWGWAAVGVGLAPLGLWARARRWHYLFPPGADPPGLVPAIMIGYLANNVLPLRAGEIVRVYVVARRWGHGFWLVLATLVVERVLDSLVVILMLAALVLVIAVPPFLQWSALVLLLIDLAGIGVLVTLALAPHGCRRVLGRVAGRWPPAAHRLARIFETFVTGLHGIQTPAHLLPMVAWTVAVWVLPAGAAWALLRAVHLDLPFLAGWTVLAFVGVGVSLPSAPGYVGVFHAAAALAVGLFGVGSAAAVGYALLLHASQYLPVTLLGWLFLLREQVSLGEVAQAGATEAEAPRG